MVELLESSAIIQTFTSQWTARHKTWSFKLDVFRRNSLEQSSSIKCSVQLAETLARIHARHTSLSVCRATICAYFLFSTECVLLNTQLLQHAAESSLLLEFNPLGHAKHRFFTDNLRYLLCRRPWLYRTDYDFGQWAFLGFQRPYLRRRRHLACTVKEVELSDRRTQFPKDGVGGHLVELQHVSLNSSHAARYHGVRKSSGARSSGCSPSQ